MGRVINQVKNSISIKLAETRAAVCIHSRALTASACSRISAMRISIRSLVASLTASDSAAKPENRSRKAPMSSIEAWGR